MKNVRTPQGGIFFDSHCYWVLIKAVARTADRTASQ